MMWSLATCCRGSRSTMWFFDTCCAAAVGDFEISRQARSEFEISISIITQSGDFKVTATGGKKHIIDSPPCSCLGSFLRFICLEEIDFFCVEHTVTLGLHKDRLSLAYTSLHYLLVLLWLSLPLLFFFSATFRQKEFVFAFRQNNLLSRFLAGAT